ncbi:C-type isolectin Sp-CL4-like [Aulostomus maculatus]
MRPVDSAVIILVGGLMILSASAYDDEMWDIFANCERNVPLNHCIDGGFQLDENRCMALSPTESDFDSAEAECQREGGNLVSIHNQTQYDTLLCLMLATTYRREHFWLGAKKNGDEFEWTDGSGTMTFNHWREGMPDNFAGNEDCVAMNSGSWGPWNDAPCAEEKYFVCQKPLTGIEEW